MEYFGGEIGTVVVDPGNCFFKAGFSGECSPDHFLPNVIGYKTDNNEILSGQKLEYFINNKNHDNVVLKYPVDKNGVSDWKGFEGLFKEAFEPSKMDYKEHPLILSESTMASTKQREEMLKTVIETLGFGSYFAAKAPVLSCFAVGRSSGLVLDVGSIETRCVPVVDGFVLKSESKFSEIAGDAIDEQLCKALLAKNKGKGVLDTISEGEIGIGKFIRQRILRDIKENYCLIKLPTSNQKIDSKDYKLPDGTLIELNAEDRFMPAEILFDFDSSKESKGIKTLPKIVVETLMDCDSDLRKNLIGNVIVSGKAFLMKGFYKRLFSGINECLPPALNKLKIIMPSDNVRRSFEVAWIGGSILGSLDSFKQMMISRSEYEETGASIVHDKCP